MSNSYIHPALPRTARVVACLAGLAALACQSSNSASSDSSTLGLSSCDWPSEFSAVDAGDGQCWAAHAYLACGSSNGAGMTCMSNSLTECPGANLMQGVSYSGCKNQCNLDEYALACGEPGPGPWPQPPASCRTLPSGPGGGSFSCCPCAP